MQVDGWFKSSDRYSRPPTGGCMKCKIEWFMVIGIIVIYSLIGALCYYDFA